MVQLSHPNTTTGKTIALTMQTFVGKVMSLLFNTLSRFVIAFLPRSKLSFNFMAAVTFHSDFEVQENKSCTNTKSLSSSVTCCLLGRAGSHLKAFILI